MGFIAKLDRTLCVIDIVDIIVSASGDIMSGETIIGDRGLLEHKI